MEASRQVAKAERTTVGKSTNFGFIYEQSARGFARYARIIYGLGGRPQSAQGRPARRFPNEESALRLIRALAVEIHEDWIEAHRHLYMETLREQRKELHRWPWKRF